MRLQVPTMTNPGNHETEPQGNPPNKMLHAAFNARYPSPQNPTVIPTQTHQGYCNPNDSGLGVNNPGLAPNTTTGTVGYCSFDLAYKLRTENDQNSNS